MKKLFTLLAALLFLGGLMAQESNYYLRDSRGDWDPEHLNSALYLQWIEEDQEYQVGVYLEGRKEFEIVILDDANQITSSLGYSAIEASCAGIREGEDGWFGVISGGGLVLKIKLNAEGSIVIECEDGCNNIITADYVLLFRENGDWDHETAVFMENNPASVTKQAGTYQFALVPTVEYFGDNGWDHKLGFGNVEGECSSHYLEGEEGTVKVTLAEAGDISVTVNGDHLCVNGNFAGPEYYLVGSFSCNEENCWELDQADPMYDNTITTYWAAGTYEFKVVTPAIISGEDTNWTSALGYDALDPECSSENIQEGTNGNIKVTLPEGGSGNVTVQYMAGYVCVTGEFATPPSYYLVGPFCNWNPTEALPMTGDSIVMNWEAGTYEFKVLPAASVADSSWNGVRGYAAYCDPECSSENIQTDANDNFKVTLAEAGSVKIKEVGGYFCVTGNFVNPSAPTITSWTVAGGAEIAGVAWDPTATVNDMTESNGVWTLVKTGVEIAAAGTYYYKVAANHAWEVSYPADGNQTLAIYKPGTYTITYTWVPAENSLTATAVEQTTWTIAGEEAIAGAVWNAEYTDNDMIGSDGTWTLVKQNVVLTELRNYYYKVARNHSWEVSYPAEGNQTLAIYKRGTYNITYTWVPATSTLTAEATWLGWPTDIENADATTVRKLIENGQLVIIRDGKRYNATGQLVK